MNKSEVDSLPSSDIPPDQLCSDTLVKNSAGQIVRGTSVCADPIAACEKEGQNFCVATLENPNTDLIGLAGKILYGESVAGIAGTAPNRLPDCTSDGQGNCVVNGIRFKSAALSGILDSDIRSGVHLGGVSGSIMTSMTNCAVDGQVDCLTVANFPAVDRNGVLAANASAFRSNVTLLGVTGTLSNCVVDAEVGCIAHSPNFAAMLKATASAKILSGQSLGGVSGTGLGRPSDCATDGEISCVSTTTFPALNKATLSANLYKVASTLSIAGLSGTIPACSSDGQSACLAKTLYPAVDKSALASNAAKIRNGLTLAAVTGTMADCSSDGAISCFAVANFPALQKSGAAAKILFGQFLAGISGTAPIRPTDCTTDGALSCVTVTAYPAMDAAASPSKILQGQSLAGIVGTAALKPSDCSSDSETDCVTTANYPAVKKVDLQSAVAKFKSDLSFAGVSGTLTDCGSDGAADCIVTGPLYKAAALTGASGKIITGATLAGVAGTIAPKPGDCTSDGATTCVATASFPAANASTAAAKIVLGQSVAGITGTAAGVRPSDCAFDAELSCVTVSAYPALQASTSASKIAAGDSLGGIVGTATVRPSDCSTDGGLNCVAVSNFPTVDAGALSSNRSKMKTNLTVAGITGTLADCSADGATACVAVAAYPAAQVTGAAAKILLGSSVAAVSGSAPLRPADCSADGSTSCVAITNYPAIDKSTVDANRMRSGLTLGGVAGSLNDCASDGGSSCYINTNYAAANVIGAAAKILSGQTLAAISGTGVGRPTDCSVDGATNCTAVAAFPAIGTSNLNTAKARIHSSLTIATVAGTLLDCAADGETNCSAVAAFPAMNANLAAEKISSGLALGGITGSAAIKPADCTTDGATNCTTVAAFPSVDATVLAGKAAKISLGTSVALVAGTLANCASDGSFGCVAIATYPATLVSGAAAKIRSGQTLGGVNGTAPIPPGACSIDNGSNCITNTDYPAVDKTALSALAPKFRSGLTLAGVAGALADCAVDNDTNCVTSASNPSIIKANATAGMIKSGTVIAGVTGDFPSVAYPLTGATATADLMSASFNAKMASSTAFEYWTSAGTRYTGAGDANLVGANLHASVFGVSAGFGLSCIADGQTGCISTSTFKAMQLSNVTSWDLRRGITLGGLAGSITFPKNAAMLSYYNRSTGYYADSSTSNADIYDTTDDQSSGNPTVFPLAVPYGTTSWWYVASPDSIVIRDPSSDDNANGLCDGGEVCIYYDRNTQKKWAKRTDPGTGSFEDTLTACINNYNGTYGTGWRLPTQKEAMQAYIDGFGAKNVESDLPNAYYRVSTTFGTSTDATFFFNMNNGDQPGPSGKGVSFPYHCIHD